VAGDLQAVPFPPVGIAFYSKDSAVGYLPCKSGEIFNVSSPCAQAEGLRQAGEALRSHPGCKIIGPCRV